MVTAQHDPLRDVSVTDEAYATIVAQDGWHACSAAVLGRILRRIDPSRPRAVLVHKVSSATRALLKREGLWDVVSMHHPFKLPQSALPWFGTLHALQAQLWSLPYRRVLYLDTDHLPLVPQHLLGIWRWSSEGVGTKTTEIWKWNPVLWRLMLHHPPSLSYPDPIG